MQNNDNDLSEPSKPVKPDIETILGLMLISIGIIGCIIGIFLNSNGWYVGPAIPIGYLMISK